ncbi:hypothetical protein EYF80_034187 [Liparis tanakae]|uniref:Uncharacterized protein n=1 Tax=Liparis tanakae TaxID=230148 RepID=A0A4Z2GQS3_9TELE|nr:hypothetical protein EYF80_034187 [Liparis tanakae]
MIGTKEIKADTTHTKQTIALARHLLSSTWCRSGLVMAMYRSTAMTQSVSMLAVTHRTSTEVQNSQNVSLSCQLPVTTIAAPRGTTRTPMMRSAHARDMMKMFVVVWSCEVRATAMMTSRFPTTMVRMMMTSTMRLQGPAAAWPHIAKPKVASAAADLSDQKKKKGSPLRAEGSDTDPEAPVVQQMLLTSPLDATAAAETRHSHPDADESSSGRTQ